MINPQSKEPRRYQELARPYSKGSELAKHGGKNPSLAIFLERVKAVFPTTIEDATSADAAGSIPETAISADVEEV